MKQNLLMTVRGFKEMTRTCIETMCKTLDYKPNLIIVDGSEPKDAIHEDELAEWTESEKLSLTNILLYRPGCTSPQGLNIGLRFIESEICLNDRIIMKQHNTWLLNNDIVFKKRGWLRELASLFYAHDSHKLGIVGSTSMSVFGWKFVDGGIWGFNMETAQSIKEGDTYLDERLCYCCVDVDMSIRMEKAGKKNVVALGLEHGQDPMFDHLVSRTTYGHEGEQVVLEKRRPEFRHLIDKHGRLDGQEGYAGI